MSKKPIVRCVNLDWVEVYAFESQSRFPMNADYFRERGYFVKEREYGTRVYEEMFTIEGADGQPWIEVRRNPKSGDSSFTGLMPWSCHLRLTNRACYGNNPIGDLRDFMALHDYDFQRIFRIDVCLDFEYFDKGDDPARFAQRYVAKRYRKINQANLSAHAKDSWADFDWETLSWGNEKSMVTTKLYNKSKELSRPKHDKPYIRYKWWLDGLIDSPVDNTKHRKDGSIYKPTIWRVEFSMHAQARRWLSIENMKGKRMKRTEIPHTLELFDSRDKLVERFRDLQFHYFHFKKMLWQPKRKGLIGLALLETDSGEELSPVRKDRCPDKVLFDFGRPAITYKIDQLPKSSTPITADESLRRKLIHYKEFHVSPEIQNACQVILDNLTREDFQRLSEANTREEVEILRRVLSIKNKYPEKDVVHLMQEIRHLLDSNEIF